MLDRLAKSAVERNARFPFKQLPRQRDVRLPSHRIIRPRRSDLELGRTARQFDGKRGQLEDGHFVGVADVDRSNLFLLRHHPYQCFDRVINVGEGPRLLAVAVNLEILAANRGRAEAGDHAAIVNRHAGPIGVEYSNDAYVDLVLPVVVHHQSFRDPLALVIAGAYADRVYMAPVCLSLRVLFRIAVHFAGGSEQDSRVHALCHAEHVDGAHDAGLYRLDRVVLVVNGRGGTRKMKNAIDFEQDGFDDVVTHQLEVRVIAQVHNVAALAAEIVVEADHLVPVAQQPLAQMGAEESRAAGNQYSHALLLQRRVSPAIEST